ADRLATAFPIPLALPGVEGTAYVADEAPDLEALLEEAAESDTDRSALRDDGWYVLGDRWDLREVLSFEYLSTPAGGTLAWWLLDAGDGRCYVLYQPGDEPTVAFAWLDGE